ncbi:MAG: acyl-CoA dehydrogenase family protein [Chloroflexota bacterium]|nr:acyl-CoA dehydrogenase family protein [Chloroflexota bacterium]MDE3193363.1 acyl-CoA dehydrogenase family protein [Chloroflexota bacterium]
MPDRSFLRWPFFDEDHRRLAEEAEVWAGRELAAASDDDVDRRARELVRSLGSAGWVRHVVPGSHGGARAAVDVRGVCLLREVFARHDGLADAAFAMQGLGSLPISLFGSPALRDRYLPEVATGKRVCAFALSEPEAGSDVAAVRATARREGDSYVLDGTKTWISNAGIADQYVVFARTADGGAKGLSAFVVDADARGLDVVERIRVIAPHPLGTLRFDRCRVPADRLVGSEGEGFRIAMATLDLFRPTVGAAALGFARRALDEAVARVKARTQFGQTLDRFQLVQERIAQMALDVDASALLVYRAAWAKDSGAERITREASMAKLFATEAAQRVADTAVQLYGGLGVTQGVAVERLYREVRALRIYEGTSEIQSLVIAGQVLQPRDA